MKRYKAEPKKTQAELIDVFIIRTARNYANDYDYSHGYTHTEFINSKNLATLQAMAKRGVLDYAPYSKIAFVLSAKSMAQYGALIRDLALAMLQEQFNQEYRWHTEARRNVSLDLYLRFVAKNVSKRYWENDPNFQFIEWQFHDDMGKYHSLTRTDFVNNLRCSEERIQDIERAMAFVEVMPVPTIEVCAM